MENIELKWIVLALAVAMYALVIAFQEKKVWFRPNGDIRMDNDIFADVVSKPMDITLSSNETFSIFDSNSIFSGRGNEMKLSYINFFPQS